jgi:hypothetical protein
MTLHGFTWQNIIGFIHTAVLNSHETVPPFLLQECIHSSYSSEVPEKIINIENTRNDGEVRFVCTFVSQP